jgi:hypothetical protein
MFMIDLSTLALAVWTMGAANIGAFIVMDSQPMQPLNQLLFSSGLIAFLIRIFYPKDKGATAASRQKKRIQSRTGIPNMHSACR